MRCPQCEQEQWVEGGIVEMRGQQAVFKPKHTKLIVLRYPNVSARACKVCGYLLLGVDVEALKKTLKDEN
jgi:predicted nucleic-acid-binding Zn-ribbon protein